MTIGGLKNTPIVTEIGYINCKEMLEMMIYGKIELLSQPRIWSIVVSLSLRYHTVFIYLIQLANCCK